MLLIYSGNKEFAALCGLKLVFTQLNICKERIHSILSQSFLFNNFLRLLRILIILPRACNKFFKYIIIYLRTQAFNKIRIVIARMELHKFNLLLLFCS